MSEWDQYIVEDKASTGTSSTDWEQYAVGTAEEPKQAPQSAFSKFLNAAVNPVTKTMGIGAPSDFTNPASAQLAYEGKPVQAFTAGFAGDLADAYSSPLGLVTGGVSKMAPQLSKIPAFRRFLQAKLPKISEGLLKKNPMAPIYKELDGIQRDMTKPLPPKPGKLVMQGRKLVDSVHGTLDKMGQQYDEFLKPFYGKKADISDLPQEALQDLGLIPKGVNVKKLSIEKLWKTRQDLNKMIGNPWKKEELLKKTTLKEDEIVNLISRMKATVLNNVDDTTRQGILRLDPTYEEAIKSGKGLLSMAHNPETGKINTTRLVNVFKNKNDQGSQELFKQFGFYDKSVGEVQNALAGEAYKQWLKDSIGNTVIGTGVLGGLGYGIGRAMQSR